MVSNNNNNTNSSKMTKRKRRSIPNPATKWIQHPKITSPAARARAYLVDAGLYESSSPSSSSSKSQKKTTKITKTELLDPKLDLNSPEVKFGKMIGGTSEVARHKAIKMLKQYFEARCDIRNENGGISELDLMKLWKGMWHTLYMADKVPVQDALSKHLAKLMWSLGGTEEEDEYAAQVYLDMDEQNRNEEEGEEEEEEEEGDFVMAEIENTLDDNNNDYDDDEKEEEEEDTTDSSTHDEIEQDENDDNNNDEEEEEEEEEDEDDEEVGYAIQKHCRGAHLVSLYVRTFFRTVRREWGNMDKHRVDKFYTAIRFMVHEMYKYMSTRHWNIGIIRLFNDALFEEVLDHTPNGLRFHLIDLTLSELAKANYDSPLPLTEATFLDCMEPYFAMAQTAEDKVVHGKVMENIMVKFLEEHSFVCDAALKLFPQQQQQQQQEEEEEDQEEDDEAKQMIFDQVHVGSIAQFIFGMASDPDTADRHRKRLYDMHKMYSKKIKAAGRDVEMNADDDDDDDDLKGGEVVEEENFGEDGIVRVDDESVPKVSAVKNDDQKEEEEEEEEDVASSAAKDDNKETQEEAAEKSKKGKKGSAKKDRKRRRKRKAKDDDDNDKVVEEEKMTNKEESTSNEKSKVEKKSSEAEKEKEDKQSESQKAEEEVVTPSKKKKRKKKKGKKGSSVSEDGDEVITISTKEQKEAAKAASTKDDDDDDDGLNSTPVSKKKKNEKPKKNLQRSPPSVDPHAMLDSDNVMSDIETDNMGPPTPMKKTGKKKNTTAEKDRRVSFGRVNHSKSYKASMKALKTMDQPSTACRTPDRSILLNKRKGMEDSDDEESGGKKSKKARGVRSTPRKRAIDYF